jgi:maleate cis-trans isomerase
VATDYLLEYAREVDRPEAGALFICCGALRALDIGDRPSTSRS